MNAVFSAFLDPLLKNLLLLGSQGILGFGRRHDLVRILCENPIDQLALIGLSRHEGFFLQGARPVIQAKFGLAGLFVRPMASIALGSQNGTHIPIVIDPSLHAHQGCSR